jgi:hypothetical protein
MSANCHGEMFTIDSWSNLTDIGDVTDPDHTGTGCTRESLSLSVGTNNQISGFCYDAAGNLTATSGYPTCASPAYTYNAENQLSSAGGVTYTYDGDGKRV